MSKKPKPKKTDIALWEQEGAQAWNDGKPPKGNPYVYDTHAAYYWTRGWAQQAIRTVREEEGKSRSWRG